jgi:DNA modification methylase
MTRTAYDRDGITIIEGDCLEAIGLMDAESVDAIVTDPPYEMGFMGKRWDATGVAYDMTTWGACLRVLKPGGHLLAFGGARTYHRMVCAVEAAGLEIRDQIMWLYGSGFPKSQTALKPAHEPIVLARKPLAGSVAANMLKFGPGAINVDGCRIGTEGGGTHCGNRDGSGKCLGHDNAGRSTSGETVHGPESVSGRWPANLILDEQAAADAGEWSRYFYCAKASTAERNAGCNNNHPTVKPISLMRYLCRLVTPPGGLILDPFCGSGSTGVAAIQEGFRFVGIELDSDYCRIARARLEKGKP